MAKDDIFDLPHSISTTDVYHPNPKSKDFEACQSTIDNIEWNGYAYTGDTLDMNSGPMRNRRK